MIRDYKHNTYCIYISEMASLRLVGYLTVIDDKRATLYGDNTMSWKHLDSTYWKRGMCKHINSDKTECTIKFDSSTQFEKSGEMCSVRDLDGCYVDANVCIKKYTFFSSTGAKVAGWQIIVKKIKNTTILI